MTLLVTVFAAAITTAVWYAKAPDKSMKLGFLTLMYWGASLMWLIDAIFEYLELGEEYFNPSGAEMLNDLYLGLSVVALALIVWLMILLIKDPKGSVRKALQKKS